MNKAFWSLHCKKHYIQLGVSIHRPTEHIHVSLSRANNLAHSRISCCLSTCWCCFSYFHSARLIALPDFIFTSVTCDFVCLCFIYFQKGLISSFISQTKLLFLLLSKLQPSTSNKNQWMKWGRCEKSLHLCKKTCHVIQVVSSWLCVCVRTCAHGCCSEPSLLSSGCLHDTFLFSLIIGAVLHGNIVCSAAGKAKQNYVNLNICNYLAEIF